MKPLNEASVQIVATDMVHSGNNHRPMMVSLFLVFFEQVQVRFAAETPLTRTQSVGLRRQWKTRPALKTNQIQHKCKSLGGTDTHSPLEPEEMQPRAVSKRMKCLKAVTSRWSVTCRFTSTWFKWKICHKVENVHFNCNVKSKEESNLKKKSSNFVVFLISPPPAYSNSQWKTGDRFRFYFVHARGCARDPSRCKDSIKIK